MIRIFLVLLFAAVVAAGCKTDPAAFEASKVNKVAIVNVKLGQTMDQVRATMGKPPESTAERLLDNGDRETTWNYLTDYHSETDTAITFRNGKVVSIAPAKWSGCGDFPPKK
jgi:outer membrane protein assembly factor BamE (lipoprotein component of BamABCDE complex)